jgi:CheY-like chemotaxis protein
MQKKALVVDNDFFFVEFLSDLLVKRGYQVSKAYNGKQGIAELEDKTVDILFSDLILPKIDGRQFFKFIREKYNGNHFPMVALSGSMIGTKSPRRRQCLPKARCHGIDELPVFSSSGD